MVKSKLWLVASAGVLTIALSCQVDRSTAPIILAPVRVSKIAAPPGPQTYTLSSQGGSSVELTGNNYPYNTWITVVPNGPEFMLTAYGPAQPPTGLVGATGAAGGRNGCALNAVLMYDGVSSGFGPCGGTVGTDTVLAKQQWFLRQGSMPLDYPEIDCPPHPGTCHTQEIANTTFTVAPIPALMVPVKAFPRTVQFSSVQYQEVTFTTGANPAEIFVGGRLNGIPVTPTSWVYTAGDGTLDGNMCGGGYPYYPCTPYLHKAGRMVVKAFIAGWEQTATVTVQCAIPGDPALNDSITDFSVREELLNVLAISNPDSSPGAGRNENNPRGWRHESGGVIWRLPNGGGFMFVPYDDPFSSQGSYNLPNSQWDLSNAPVPGATPYAPVHSHPNDPGDILYRTDRDSTKLADGTPVPFSRWPGDTLDNGYPRPLDHKQAENPYNAGSDNDQNNVVGRNLPTFIVSTDTVGYVFRLNVPPPGAASTSTPFRKNSGTAAERKCAWPKKYQ